MLKHNDVIVGFDPGGSTGYCVGRMDEKEVLGFKVVRCQVIPWNDRIPMIKALLRHYRPTTVICEDFVLYANKAKAMVGEHMLSSEVIGIIKTWMYEYGLGEPIMPMASEISRTQIPGAHTKHIPQLSADMQEHAKDAYKHVRHYVVKHKAQASAAAAVKQHKLEARALTAKLNASKKNDKKPGNGSKKA